MCYNKGEMNAGTIIVISLSIFLLLWYIGGHLYNRWRGQYLVRWLEEGLDVVGEERQRGWIGSPASGARILIHRAHPPFQRMEITLLLENREIPILWLADRLQRKRDSVIIRATHQSPGDGEVRVGPLSEMYDPQFSSWNREQGPHGLLILHRGPGAPRQLAKLTPWLDRYSPYLRRFILQRRDPHLTVWIDAAGLEQSASAAAFFNDLKNLL